MFDFHTIRLSGSGFSWLFGRKGIILQAEKGSFEGVKGSDEELPLPAVAKELRDDSFKRLNICPLTPPNSI